MTRRAAASLIFLASLVACDTNGRDADCPCPGTDSVVVDRPLLAFLSRARSAHHAADLFEEGSTEEPERALSVLRRVTEGPPPPTAAPEIAEVLADTWARIAELEGQMARFDDATRSVERGLALAPKPSYYEGHLHEVLGMVEEQRHRQLLEQGRGAEAAEAKTRALLSLERSMQIQEHVIGGASPSPNPKKATERP